MFNQHSNKYLMIKNTFINFRDFYSLQPLIWKPFSYFLKDIYMKLKPLVIIILVAATFSARAQDTSMVKNLEIYGFAQTDMGYNFNQINPAWSDAMRITKLPSYKDQFAPDGQVFFGVRQS